MHLLITDQPHIVFPTVAAAEAAVAVLDDGEDFTYIVVADPSGTGKAIVKVLDAADGSFIANL